MKELARLAVEAESEPARVTAIKELLDRAYGRPGQAVDIDARFAGSMHTVIEMFGVRPSDTRSD